MKKQNDKNDITTRKYCDGVVECRICGLKFMPKLAQDRRRHKREHRKILSGGLPYDIREFIKRAAWDALSDKHGPENESATRHDEIAKRAVVFAWWARAVSNGIPEQEFEDYMAAHLAFVDASVSGDEKQRKEASQVSKRWKKYG